MKNILVCSADFDEGITGAFHFARFVLDINKISDTYRIWLLTEDLNENAPQRNDNLSETLIKVPLKYPKRLYPFVHFFRNWAYYKAIKNFQKRQPVNFILFNQAMFGVFARFYLPKSIRIAGVIHDDHSLLPNRNSLPTFKSYLFYRYLQRPLELMAIRSLDLILPNSDYIKQLILTKTNASAAKVVRLYQTIDVQTITFKPSHWTYTEGECIKILFVKAGYVRGGLEELIQALGLLAAYTFQLTVVGTTSSAESIIQNWARPFPNIQVLLTGILLPSDVYKQMHNHHILCIPSRKEALGLANAEGLAHGISVVSTKVGGIPEVMDDGKCGWLAQPNDVRSLADNLSDCINSTLENRLQKAEHGRKHVETHLSKEIMLDNIIGILDRYSI